MVKSHRAKTVELSDGRYVHAAMLDNGRYGLVFRNSEGLVTEFSLSSDAALVASELLQKLMSMPDVVRTPEGEGSFPDWKDPHPRSLETRWVLVNEADE